MKPILGDSEQDGKLSLGEFGRAAMGGGVSIGGGATAILQRRTRSAVSATSSLASSSGRATFDGRQTPGRPRQVER